jgi:hypothetical protein
MLRAFLVDGSLSIEEKEAMDQMEKDFNISQEEKG